MGEGILTTIEIERTPRAKNRSLADISTIGVPAMKTSIPTSDTFFSVEDESVQIKVFHEQSEELQKPKWFQPVLHEIAALPWTTNIWSSDANRMQPAAVVRMLNVLVEILTEWTPTPSIVPTWEGGVQAEWHRNGVDLEIEVSPKGEIEYFFKGPDDYEKEGRAEDDIHKLIEYAQKLL